MRVRAIEKGHDGTQVRAEGEEWDAPDSAIGKDGKPVDGSTWYEAAENTKPAPKAKSGPQARPPGTGPLPGSRAKD